MNPGLPAFAALAAQNCDKSAGWAVVICLSCLSRFPSDDVAPKCVIVSSRRWSGDSGVASFLGPCFDMLPECREFCMAGKSVTYLVVYAHPQGPDAHRHTGPKLWGDRAVPETTRAGAVKRRPASGT